MSANKVIRRNNRSRATALGLGVWLLSSAFPAFATNVLQQVSHAPGAKGGVEITLQFADPIADAQVFTTDNPPRIAIDLPDTHNGMAGRKVAIGNGSASTVSAAEANGRTRVVVDLFRPAAYESRIEGNRLVLSVAGSGAAPAMVGNSARMPVLGNTADPAKHAKGDINVSNIDFRRGANGSGKIVMRFSGEGAAADMHNEGTRIVLDVGNATIPASLSRHMDVSDFATPVQSIDPREQAGGTRLVINTNGAVESSAYQTGNEYVVEISPKKGGRADMDASRIGGPLGKAVYKGKPATFNFQDVPVRTVLQLIAEESNLNIVAADTVGGNVTLRLINVPWDQALDIVLRAKSLDKRQDGGVIWVAPQKELADYEQAMEDARIAIEQRAETILEYIPVNYGSAEDIAKLLTEDSKTSSTSSGTQQNRGFLSPRGSVSFDRRSNTLILTDLPKKVAEIKQLVSILDRPVDQVLIEARIVIADEEFARALGARLGITGVNSGASSLTSYSGSLSQAADNITNFQTGASLHHDIPGSLNVNLPVTSPAGSIGFSIVNGGHVLDLELSAMQTEGKGDVISNPRVITSNQKEAVISQGDEIGYVTITGGTAGAAATPNVQFKDVLLQLKVTPTITNDNRVYMALDIDKDELAKFITVANFGDVPQITKRKITTAVLVDSGQTVVIGGVYEFKSREDMTKVPFLGDLPGLGNLFRTKSKSANKAELLVFVTPKILQVRQRDQVSYPAAAAHNEAPEFRN